MLYLNWSSSVSFHQAEFVMRSSEASEKSIVKGVTMQNRLTETPAELNASSKFAGVRF